MLQDWIALPSIAAENRNYPHGAEYMATLARNAGFQRVDMVPTSGKPGVFAVYDAGAATTLGVYFMYDVKQYDDAAEWSSPPLEAKIVERPGVGKICVGRGATNTKGPQTALLAELHAFRSAGKKLPINIVMVCEAEEEIGSPNFSQTETDPEPKLIKAQVTTYRKSGIEPLLWPRLAGSWPGVTFTGAPLKLPAGQFGLGHGSGAHAPDEYFLIESANPKVAGIDGAVKSYVDFFYALASGLATQSSRMVSLEPGRLRLRRRYRASC